MHKAMFTSLPLSTSGCAHPSRQVRWEVEVRRAVELLGELAALLAPLGRLLALLVLLALQARVAQPDLEHSRAQVRPLGWAGLEGRVGGERADSGQPAGVGRRLAPPLA